ncbi:MAG: HPr family phosphocarrier protein [Parvibaculum sp.]|jgi:phosphocarrier protein|uniref:HPr family phosphocarrier protein n=1 Tax=Parvibaculum sp. TaxID=2024848 RepID=UPI0028514955|nr:HPr family phosphocarrier protein [Parvibaculum sp.]MDR3500832.1 HPr family phosphocarrier protein [Parvibaculum sp.]
MDEASPDSARRPLNRLLNIVNSRGLHARASAKFVQCAEKYDAAIKVSKDGNEVSGTSIMGLMMLAAAPGCCILIEADGPEAEAALEALSALVSDGFGERD